MIAYLMPFSPYTMGKLCRYPNEDTSHTSALPSLQLLQAMNAVPNDCVRWLQCQMTVQDDCRMIAMLGYCRSCRPTAMNTGFDERFRDFHESLSGAAIAVIGVGEQGTNGTMQCVMVLHRVAKQRLP